jgi:DNA-binding beta-propeller fold protein YncE
MNWKNRKLIMVLIFVIVPGAFASVLASDNLEWDVYQTLQLDATPIDVALTPDGRKIYILTEQGEILIYSSSTKPEAKIDVGKHVDQIKLGPKGDTLILSSGKKKTVQVITIDFIQTINTSGSPFKGPAEAPVVIAVFDDFQ